MPESTLMATATTTVPDSAPASRSSATVVAPHSKDLSPLALDTTTTTNTNSQNPKQNVSEPEIPGNSSEPKLEANTDFSKSEDSKIIKNGDLAPKEIDQSNSKKSSNNGINGEFEPKIENSDLQDLMNDDSRPASSRFLFSSESSELSDLSDSEAETEKMNYSNSKDNYEYGLNGEGELKSQLLAMSKETEKNDDKVDNEIEEADLNDDEDSPISELNDEDDRLVNEESTEQEKVIVDTKLLENEDPKKIGDNESNSPLSELIEEEKEETLDNHNKRKLFSEEAESSKKPKIEIKSTSPPTNENDKTTTPINNNETADEDHLVDEREEDHGDDEDEGDDEDGVPDRSIVNGIHVEEDEETQQKKKQEELQRQKIHKKAVEKLTEIEIEFAALKDKLYEDKLKTFESEIQMCINGIHPALKSIYERIENHRTSKLKLVQNRQKYQLLCIDRQTRSQRLALHQQYLKEKSQRKMEIIDKSTVIWYDINRDRKMMNMITPEYSYRVSNNRQDQIDQMNVINQELDKLNHVNKDYGFVVSDNLTSSSKEEIQEDMAALGLI